MRRRKKAKTTKSSEFNLKKAQKDAVDWSLTCGFHSNIINYSVFSDYITVRKEFTINRIWNIPEFKITPSD